MRPLIRLSRQQRTRYATSTATKMTETITVTIILSRDEKSDLSKKKETGGLSKDLPLARYDWNVCAKNL